MSTIIIKHLDEPTTTWLESEAKLRGISVEEIVVDLIHAAVDIQPTPQKSPPYHNLDDLAGTWTEEDAAIFESAIADFERVDEELWR